MFGTLYEGNGKMNIYRLHRSDAVWVYAAKQFNRLQAKVLTQPVVDAGDYDDATSFVEAVNRASQTAFDGPLHDLSQKRLSQAYDEAFGGRGCL